MFIHHQNNTLSYRCQYASDFDSIDTAAYALGMGNLRQNIQKEMQQRGWNDYALADHSGVSQATIHRILSGVHNEPRGDTVKKLAAGFGISEKRLRGFEETDSVNDQGPDYAVNARFVEKTVRLVPLISSVTAGNWCESIDNYQPGDAEEWLPCPIQHGKHTYALRVIGDSMTNPYSGKSFPDGVIIFVDPEKQITNGCRVVAKLPGSHEATFKEYREDSGRRYLKPLNPQYPTLEIDDNTLLCGVVVGHFVAE